MSGKSGEFLAFGGKNNRLPLSRNQEFFRGLQHAVEMANADEQSPLHRPDQPQSDIPRSGASLLSKDTTTLTRSTAKAASLVTHPSHPKSEKYSSGKTSHELCYRLHSWKSHAKT